MEVDTHAPPAGVDEAPADLPADALDEPQPGVVEEPSPGPVGEGEEFPAAGPEEEGSSIEEMAGDPEVQEPPPIEGALGQLSLLAGGEEPTSASMRLRGGALPVEGEFEKGDVVTLIIEARVGEVHFVDRVDPSGFVTSVERRHVARVQSARRA